MSDPRTGAIERWPAPPFEAWKDTADGSSARTAPSTVSAAAFYLFGLVGLGATVIGVFSGLVMLHAFLGRRGRVAGAHRRLRWTQAALSRPGPVLLIVVILGLRLSR